MANKIVPTADGSNTLYSSRYDQHYHSTHGALQESMHVFIKSGLNHIAERSQQCNLLEYGFGSGLNALLAMQFAQEHLYQINYLGFEPYPISPQQAESLGYLEMISAPELQTAFSKMHALANADSVKIGGGLKLGSHFNFDLRKAAFGGELPADHYQLVFFDAFSPGSAAECWEQWVFEKMHATMAPGACLLTYCSKGVVRRTMIAAGFEVEKIPGPPGKREILRATKP